MYSKLFDKSELLHPLTEDYIERDFDRLDEVRESTDEDFNRLEGKVKKLTRKRGDTNNEDTSKEGSEEGSKKPKLSKNFGSDSNTDDQKSSKESDSTSTEAKFEKEFDKETDSNTGHQKDFIIKSTICD